MSWNLNEQELKELKRKFNVAANEISYDFNLSEVSKRLEELLLNKAFTNLYYDESLYICCQGRLHSNNPKILNIVYCFLDFAKKNCDDFELNHNLNVSGEDQEELIRGAWSKNNSLHFIAVEKIREITGMEPSLNNCISIEEKEEIENFLNTFLDPSETINFTLDEFLENKQIKLLEKLQKYPPIQKAFNQMIEIFNIFDKGEDFDNIAKSCIAYVIKENDVIKDSIGLLGLIDDLFAIDYCYKKLKNDEIQPLVDRHDTSFPSFKIPELVSARGALSLINLENTIKASYTNSDTNKPLRRVMIVPDTGPLAVLTCLFKSITDRMLNMDRAISEQKFSYGDRILLGNYRSGLRRKKIIVELDKPSDDPRFSKLQFAKLKDGRQAIPSFMLSKARLADKDSNLCSLKHLNNFKSSFDNREVSSWASMHLKENISNAPSNGPILLLSTKVNAKKYLKEKIYGKEIQSWLGVKEFMSNGDSSITEISMNQLFPEPNIYLIADPIIASNILNNLREKDFPSLVVIDNDDFYKDQDFIRALRSLEVDTVAYLEFYKHHYLKNLLAKENGFSSLPSKLDDLVAVNAGYENSPTARFITRTKRPNNRYIKIELKLLSSFYEHLLEIKDLLRNDDYQFVKHRLYLAHTTIRRRISKPDEVEMSIIRTKLKECIKEIEYAVKFEDGFKKILFFLKENLENLISSNREKYILDFIEKHQDKNLAMVVAPIQYSQGKMIERKATEIIRNENLKFKVFTFDDLENDKDFEKDYLIIPSFITKQKMPKLRNSSFALNHVYFATKYEEEDLHRAEERDELRFSSVFRDSKQYKEFLDTNNNTETILNVGARDLLRDAIGSQISSSFGKTNENFGFTNSRIFLFEENEVYALPINGSEYRIINGSVKIEKVNMLQEDSEILIDSNFSGEELVENILKENIEAYQEYKEIEKSAKSWKAILSDYKDSNNLSFKELQDSLKEIGVERNIMTIKHWINDNNTISPKRKDDIRKIYYLSKNKNQDELEKCIENTSKLYRASNAAREKIVARLNDTDLQGEISLEIGNLHIAFQKKIINGYIEAEIPTKKLYKIMSLDDFMIQGDLKKEIV